MNSVAYKTHKAVLYTVHSNRRTQAAASELAAPTHTTLSDKEASDHSQKCTQLASAETSRNMSSEGLSGLVIHDRKLFDVQIISR